MLHRTLLRQPLLAAAGRSSPARLRRLPNSLLSARFAAGQVSNRPGAEDLEHAATNIREELGGLGDAAATAIAGHGQLRQDGSLSGDYKSVTTAMIQAVPPHVMQWGLAGGIPYGGMALGTAYYAREAVNLAASGESATEALEMLHTVQSFQITYGAVMLSFLGAIHWGMEFAKYGGRQGHKRLALGVVPLAYAWPTLYLASPGTALVAQWGGFLFSWAIDRWAGSQGWTPKWYSTYRFYLTSIAGGSILFSLFALNRWDVASPAMQTGHGGRHPAYPSAGQGKITMARSELERIGAKIERGGADGGFLSIEKVPTAEEKKKAAAADKAKKEQAAAAAAAKAKKDAEAKKKEPSSTTDGGSKDTKSPAPTAGTSATDEDDTSAADKKSGKEAPGDSKLAQGQEVDQAPGRTAQQDAKREEKSAGSATPATQDKTTPGVKKATDDEDDTSAVDKKSGKEAPGDSKLAQGQEADQAPGRTAKQEAKRDEKSAGSKTPATSG